MLIVVDVVGKSIPSAIDMANVESALKILSKMNISPNDTIQNLNLLLFENTSAEKFITLFIGELNLETKTFNYINAGYNPSILYRKGKNEIFC
ncbi:MAG: PP2C family protein-serine/threonine phosphatase [Candidatus Kapaibacteriales bacterium]